MSDNKEEAISVEGFAYVMLDFDGKEFLCLQTFGTSRRKAKLAMHCFRNRRLEARKAAYEAVRICAVRAQVTNNTEREIERDRCAAYVQAQALECPPNSAARATLESVGGVIRLGLHVA